MYTYINMEIGREREKCKPIHTPHILVSLSRFVERERERERLRDLSREIYRNRECARERAKERGEGGGEREREV